MRQVVSLSSGRKSLGVLSMALVAACVLIAWSSASSASARKASSSGLSQAAALVKQDQTAPTTISQTVPLPKAPGKGTVVFINNGEPDTVVIGNGTEAAAKAAGWKYYSIAYDATQPASLQQALLNALAKHPTVVTEAGTPQTQFGKSVLARYKAAHVVIIPTSVTPATHNAAILPNNNEVPNGNTASILGGKMLAAWFVKDSKGKGKALVPDIQGYPVLHSILRGFEQETKRLCSRCTVTAMPISLADVAAGKLVGDAVSAIQRDGSNYLMFENGEFGTGAEAALKAAGLKVTVCGSAPQPAQITEVRNGLDEGWVNVGFQYVGWATMDLAYRYKEHLPLTNNDAPVSLQLIDTSNAKKVTENANTPFPADGLTLFKKLWKVK